MTPKTIPDLLSHRAATRPDIVAYTHVGSDGETVGSITYRELEIRARKLASVLGTYAPPSERVVLIFQPGLEFLTAFFGCLYAGIVAVPLHSPRPGRNDERLAAVIANAAAKVVLTTTELLPRVQQALRSYSDILRFEIVAIESLDLSSSPGLRSGSIGEEDLAFLQYTSGSTSMPKGVMVSHRNLLVNQEMIHKTFRGTEDSIVLGWLPLFHDMGLIGNILHTLWMGAQCILMSPAAFLQNPLRWLEAISRYGATISGGPDFAYRLCAEKIPDKIPALDLSSWKVAFNGSEPIRPSTLERFAQKFEPYGFNRSSYVPCYGLAEATLFVAGKAAGTPLTLLRNNPNSSYGEQEMESDVLAGGHILVGAGAVAEGLEVEIVNPETATPALLGSVGEIWVRGPSVARGYWQNDQDSNDVFRAQLTHSNTSYLRTGDLGFRVKDELFITGRLKDLVIIRGRNHYPQDIEASAIASDSVLATSVGAAFSVENDGESSVVLVQEVPRQSFSSERLAQLERSIRRSVAEQEGISLERVVLVKFGSVPRTTSGKVRRQACRAMYQSGSLGELNSALVQSSGDVYAQVVDSTETPHLAALCEVASELAQLMSGDVDPDASLLALGFDSLMMTNLRFLIEERLAISVSLESMLTGKSLRDLAMEAQVIAPKEVQSNRSPVSTVGATDVFPLSIGQKAIWFLHLLNPQSAAYNLFSASRADRPFDIPVLHKAFQLLTDRHSLLRSVVRNSAEGPIHQPLPGYQVDFATVDGTTWDDTKLDGHLREEANRPFEPSEKPPFRVQLIVQGERGDVLVVVLHHLLADLNSVSMLLDDLRCAYSALLNQKPVSLPERPHYSSFVASQANAIESRKWTDQRDFWLEYLQDAQLALSSPFDRTSMSPTGECDTVRFRLGQALTSRIKHSAASSNVSLYTYLLAAFQVLLMRVTAQDDLLIGSVVSGRTNATWLDTVGYFANQIVLRARWNGDKTFTEFLTNTQHDVSKALEYQDYPFSAVTEDFHALYGSRGQQLTRIMFGLQTTVKRADRGLSPFLMGHDGNPLLFGEVELHSIELDNEGAQFDFSMVISEGASELLGVIQYRSDLLDREVVEMLAAKFELVLDTVTADTSCSLRDVPLLSISEQNQVLRQWNQTEIAYEKDVLIHEMIERRVRTSPDAIAVRDQDGVLTYGDMWNRSSELATVLRQKGVERDTVVGLRCHRSKDLPVAILAILKAGGAFLPLDPSLPSERISYMLEQTSAAIVLSDEEIDRAELSLKSSLDIVRLDAPSSLGSAEESHAEVNGSTERLSDRLAYVIFTSGSTGRPKGVMVTHRNVANFFAGMDAHFDCRLGDKFIALTSISFDISMLELVWPLTHGAEILVTPERGRSHGTSLLSIDGKHRTRPDFSLFYFADASEQRGPERYRLLLEGSRFADRNGFKAVWTPERHFHRFGGSYPSPSLTGAAIAVVTERIAIRAGSVVLPLHDPIRVAEEWSTIDNLSGGRVGVAFASGWHVDDFVLAPEHYANRREVMLAGIERLRQLWKGDPVDAVNGNGKTIQILLHPAPVQAELPVWITASGTPATFQLAGSMGANLLTHLLGQSLDEVAANIGVYREALSRNGFDPSTRSVTLMLHTYLGQDRESVRDRVRVPFREYLRSSLGLIEKLIASLGLPVDLKNLSPKDLDDLLDFAFTRYWETSGLFGTVEDGKAMVDRLTQIGVTEIACLVDFGVDTDLVLDSLPLLCDLMKQSQAGAHMHLQSSPSPSRKPQTFLQCTPSMMKLLLAEGDSSMLGSIDVLLLGGEPLPSALVGKIRERYECRIFNMYGPTETTIWSTVEEIRGSESPISVGRPIANTQCYVVDRRGLPVIRGAVGELLIGGDGVAKGYWRRNDLTQERFVPDAFGSRMNSRLYRTGDLARHLPDGRIEVLGRTDHQVKVRGYRIELPEIEVALSAHDEIVDAVVLKRGADDDIQLAAFYVSSKGHSIRPEVLRTFLRRSLPEYMIPSDFIHVDKIPLMTSGKIDRTQLEEIASQPRSGDTNGTHVAALASGNLESIILDIWKKVLGHEAVGVDDNFFDLGGHSLLMVQVHTALTERMGRQFPLIKLLENPTIRQLAAALATDASHPSGEPVSPVMDRAVLQRDRLDEIRRNARAVRSVAL